MQPTILFAKFSREDLPTECWARIEGAGINVKFLAHDPSPQDLEDVQGLLLRLGAAASAELLEKCKSLKFVGMLGTGYGRIDTAAARRLNISVFNVADYATSAVAELVFGALIHNARHFEGSRQNIRKGDFGEPSFEGTELAGKTIGIVGLGNIGSRVAKIAAHGFGMKVKYWSRNRKEAVETEEIGFAELAEVIGTADIISLHLALSNETEGIIDDDLVSKIRPATVVVNTSPMELLELESLERRVANDEIRFIYDHPDEMDQQDAIRLEELGGCTTFPPIGYMTKEASDRKMSVFVDNIIAASADKEIPNLVN